MPQHDVPPSERENGAGGQRGCFPSFLVLGAPHSGGRTLAGLLRRFPTIYTPPSGSSFFTRDYDQGPRWYQDRFHPPDPVVAVGDVLTDHLVPDVDHAVAAARIDGLLPEVRLVAVIRDPVERALATFTGLIVQGRIPVDTSIEEYLEAEGDPHGVISSSLYGHLLLSYIDRFGERLKLIDRDRLFRQPTSVLVDVATHVGVPVTHDPRPGPKVTPAEPREPDVPEEAKRRLETCFEDDLRLLHEATGFRFGQRPGDTPSSAERTETVR